MQIWASEADRKVMSLLPLINGSFGRWRKPSTESDNGVFIIY